MKSNSDPLVPNKNRRSDLKFLLNIFAFLAAFFVFNASFFNLFDLNQSNHKYSIGNESVSTKTPLANIPLTNHEHNKYGWFNLA